MLLWYIYNTIEEIKEPHSDMTSRRECFFCFCIVLNDNIEQHEHTNCDHVHSKEIIFCVVKFDALVLFWSWKKTMSKEVD